MNSIALTISLRPAIKEQLAKEAKRRQMSMSRYIDELLEKHFEEDEDYTYTLEELDEEVKSKIERLHSSNLHKFNTPTYYKKK